VRIGSILRNTVGVVKVDVSASDHSATVVFDPEKTSVEDLSKALKQGGYEVRSSRFLD